MNVTFPRLLQFASLGLLFLRLMVGVVFLTSGWNHLKNPAARSKDLGLGRSFTIFLGTAEAAGALGVISGVLAQLAALGLVLIMLGAIHRKIFVWHTGFWGEKNSGWNYDLMILVMCLAIVFTGGGDYALMPFKWVA